MRRTDPSHSALATIPPPTPADERSPDEGGADSPLVDAILRGGWDTERDLVVLVGPSPAREAGALRRLGQHPILWFRTGDDVGFEPPAGVLRVDHLDEVAPAVRALGSLGPSRVAGRVLDPALAPLCEQVIARIERARSERVVAGEPGGVAAVRARIEHGLANLPALCRWPAAPSLTGALAGMPLVIVAPGPSLAHNIELLGSLRGRAVLLALSHAVAPLLAAGVVPDFVLAADAHDVTYHLAGHDLSAIGALVATTTAHPHMFHSASPRHLVLAEPGPVDAWLAALAGAVGAGVGEDGDPRMSVPNGGSVAHTALSLALRWGCDPIGFVGLDLSFPGGRCYVDSSPDGDVRAVPSADGRTLSFEGWSAAERRGRPPARERLVELPGWDGQMLLSSFHFSMCQRWFEETARRVNGTARLYNCSEGGVYIGGMRHIRLAGLAGRLPPPSAVTAAAAVTRAIGHVHALARRRAAREKLVDLALDLRRLHSKAGAVELSAALDRAPLLSALVDVETAVADPRGAPSGGEADRRAASLVRWASWLEPRVVEAERALARQDRAADTLRIRPLPAALRGAGGKSG